MSSIYELIAAHKAALGPDAVKLWEDDSEFIRHIQKGGRRLIEKRPRILRAKLTLVAGQAVYAAPADLVLFQRQEWGMSSILQFKPWDPSWPGPFPEISEVVTDEGPELVFTPAPTAGQIAALGADYWFHYRAAHQIDTEAVTVPVADEPLLLLAALIEAVQELTARNLVNPIQLHRGLGSLPNQGTPLAYLEALRWQWAEIV